MGLVLPALLWIIADMVFIFLSLLKCLYVLNLVMNSLVSLVSLNFIFHLSTIFLSSVFIPLALPCFIDQVFVNFFLFIHLLSKLLTIVIKSSTSQQLVVRLLEVQVNSSTWLLSLSRATWAVNHRLVGSSRRFYAINKYPLSFLFIWNILLLYLNWKQQNNEAPGLPVGKFWLQLSLCLPCFMKLWI